MAEQSVLGRFVWHDLTTPDRGGAAEFYGKALGWSAMPWETDSSYLLLAALSGPLGGVLEAKDGTPRWLPYMGTTDIEASVREAERLGGAVLTAPTDLPNAGRFAVLADPQGAPFGVYWSAASEPPAGAPQVGEFSWHELAATDNYAAFDFYQALFGWEKVREHDMGPMGVYVIFGRDGAQWGGMYNKGDQGVPGPAYWLPYVRVKDVRGAVEQVQNARGACLNGPMEVPGGDWIAQLRDPYGAFFAVHALAADVRAAQPSAAVPSREEQDAAAQAEAPTSSGNPARKKKRAANKRPANKKVAKKKAARKKAAGKKAARKKSASRKPTGKKAAGKKAAGKKARTKAAKRKAAGKKSAARKKATKKKVTGTSAARNKTTARKKTGRKKTKTAKKRARRA